VPIGARPIEARTPSTVEPGAPPDAAAGDQEAPPADASAPATRAPIRSRPAAAPPPQLAEPGAVAADAGGLDIGDPAEAAADAPPATAGDATSADRPATAGDAASADRPAPEALARGPTPEAIGLAAAATPAVRPAGEPPRTRGGLAPAGAAARPSASDAAEPAPRPAAPAATPLEAAEARPTPAEAAPIVDAARPPSAAPVDAAEPARSHADRTEQPAARTDTQPRAIGQTVMLADAPPQAQPVERSAAPAAAPVPPRVAPAPPAQQIAPVLITLAAGAAGMPDRLMLTLDPQELGRIEVEVTREGERRIAIAVLAERPETLHLLMRDAAILDRALAQAGVGAEGRSLAFDLGGGSDGRQQRGNGSGTPAASPSPQPEPARRRDPLSLLDIAI
jgi:hypothetical protein